MKKPKCKAYGTRSQGICPFDFDGGTCRGCPESIAMYGVTKEIPGKNSSHSDSASLVSRKIKSAFLFLTNSLKKRTQLFIGWINNWFHKKSITETALSSKAAKGGAA